MHHAALDRPGAHDRDLDHEIEEARRREARQHRHLRARLDLEHAHRVGVLDHRVGRRILRRHVGQRERPAAPRGDQVERAPDRREHAEREHVHLEQAERVQVVLVPFDDRAVRHRGVLDRHEAREPVARDHEAAGVLREVARESWKRKGPDPSLSDERAHELEELRDLPARGVEPGLADALGQRAATVPPRERAGEAVDLARIESECLARVAHRALGAIGDDGGGDRGAVAAVLRVEVLDHLLAPLVLEVDVDVRRLVPLLRDEALEQHRQACRIDLGDAERVAHRRVRRRPAALAEDAPLAREAHDVVHGEEVGLVGEIGDQGELVLDELADVIGRALREAPSQACFGELAQPRRRRLAGGHELLRVFVAQLVEREAARSREAQRLGEQLGRIELREPHPQPQMALAVRMERPAAGGDRLAQAHRGEQILQPTPGAHVHVHVAGRDERQAGAARELAQGIELRAVVRAAKKLRGDPGAIREARCEPVRFRQTGRKRG